MDLSCRHLELETIDRDDLDRLQLNRLREALRHALKTPFYAKHLGDRGFASSDDIHSLEDLRRLPFTDKVDLREGFPGGFLSTGMDKIVRIHVSSGTTGVPTVIYHSREDLERWSELVARSIIATGAGPKDIFQNTMSYGLFTGGLGLHYGAERAGLLVIPAGPGNAVRQFQLMKEFGSTVIHATPSYLLYLADKMDEFGVKREDLRLRKAFVGSEPHSEEFRRRLESLWDIDVYNSYGLSEMNGPGVAFECSQKSGMHLWEDAYLMEVVDPDTLEPVPDGQTGELVLTILCRDAMPLIRYRTRDLTSIVPGECACGRTHRRISRIVGRTDDMFIVGGVNLYPSQIEELLLSVPQVGANWLIVLEKNGALDRLVVKTEVTDAAFSDDYRSLDSLRNRVRDRIAAATGVHATVELHERGKLPVFEDGKARRVIDNRGTM